MPSALTSERVRRDVEVLAHAGLDIGTFLEETDSSLRRAVPYCGACMATLDPATHLLTGTYKFGALAGEDERDMEWGFVEYGMPEPTTFDVMLRSGVPAAGVDLITGGNVESSIRMRDFMRPYFGFHDELRIVATAAGQLWGGVALFRDDQGAPFSEDEVAFVSSLSASLAVGMRSGLLTRLAEAAPPVATGPAVIIVGSDDRISQASVGAETRLDELVSGAHAAPAFGIVSSLVANARRFAAGQTDVLPRSRVRLRSGQWFVLHASPLAGRDGATGDVVVTIEEARPPEIVPLVVSAFGLTARERDVAQLVLQGVDTKEIAANLHMSAYTVQDHLKSVFEKADVRSRRELIARVFFDQYVPRLGTDLGPTGWFTG